MKTLLFLLIWIFGVNAAFTADKPEWDNVNVIQVNREKPHTTMMVFEDAEKAMSFDKSESKYLKKGENQLADGKSLVSEE